MNYKLLIIPAIIIATSCSNESNDLDAKKGQLETYKKELLDLNTKITALEKEIAALDPSFNESKDRSILVTTLALQPTQFEHKIEVRGSVESRRNVMLSAEIPGRIEQINIKEGQRVVKGQVLLALDAGIIRNTIAELKTSLELAEVLYERQANLWEKKIGHRSAISGGQK